MKIIRIAALLLTAGYGLTSAETLQVSVAGQFSSTVTPTQLASPNGAFSLSLTVSSMPLATNTDLLGFDAPFSGFSYRLNGTDVSSSPDSIRFATTGNLGLFTVFFGPQSGFDSAGNPIPEFSFEGNQAFSGSTTSPMLLPDTYTVTSFTYSDATNFDAQATPGSVVTIAPTASTIPEPAPLGLLALAAGAFGLFRLRASHSQSA